jgi:hypothetical protein
MASRKKMVGVVLMVIVGLGLIIAGFFQLHRTRRLAAEGRAATASVISKEYQRGSKGRKSYYLEVQYQTESGTTLVERASVSRTRYEQVRVGATVPLRYLPDDPTVFALGVEVKPDYFFLFMGSLFLFIAGIYYLFGRESRGRFVRVST